MLPASYLKQPFWPSSLELTDLFRGIVNFRNFLRNETLKNCAFAGLDLVGCRDCFGLDLGRTALNAGQIGSVTSLRCLYGRNVVIGKLRVLFDECVNVLFDVFVR